MKKLKLISTIALTLALSACDNYTLPNPPGQTNPEPEAFFENSGIEIAPSTDAIDLVAANAANKNVPVATVTKLINFPSDEYTLEVDIQIGSNDSFSKYATVSTVLDGDVVTVVPDALNAGIQEAMTKAPGVYNVLMRFVAYAANGTTRVRLGGIDKTYGTCAQVVKTFDAPVTIEDAYYLVPNGDITKAVKMNNTMANVSPYDNPEFATKVDVTEEQAASEEGYTWQVISASAYDASSMVGALGCRPAEDNDLQGILGDTYAPGSIHLMGSVLVTVNIENKTYEIKYAFSTIWPLSGSTLTKPENALTLGTSNYINYSGVSILGASWYCCAQPNFQGDVVFMQDKNVPVEDSEDGLTRSGKLVSGKNGDLLRTPVKGTNLYWMDLDLVQLTYKISCIQSMSVIGSHNGWDTATAIPMTASKDLKTWTATDVELKGDFKINCNGAWDVNFGGKELTDEAGNKVFEIRMNNAPNMEANGTYDVTIKFEGGVFHDGNMYYTLTLKKK